ncbi:RNA-binding domain-containing protein [Weissella paramesenteroides]|jgi:predicted HTH transcriptional regulator|uniref:RNA-binding domain-containing protein n=1 Tax=Weissella paramesenteroides TaxID=1249 RepID=UPI001EE251BA|nr:RNA-binding domain-containing protein [Weissella paramesenteroides]
MESQTIEYKEEFTEKLKKEITGFLNGEETAYIYLGVDDDTRKIRRNYLDF